MYNKPPSVLIAGFIAFISLILPPSLVFASTDEHSDPGGQAFAANYEVVEGEYASGDFGFGLALPAGMKGFVWKSPDSGGNAGNYVTIQVHPEFNSTEPSQCCPTIDSAPAVMLLDSGPTGSAFFVPFTGDLYAAVQGYNMKLEVEDIAGTTALVSTLSAADRDSTANPPSRHLGKFYFMNAGNDRFLSYGLWASEEKFEEYLDEFEKSAQSIRTDSTAGVSLESAFGAYYASVPDIELEGQAGLHPELISPLNIEEVSLNQTTNTLNVSVDGSSESQQFLMVNTGKLLAGPHIVAVNGKPAESKLLRSGSDEFLYVVYDAQGPHKVTVTGTAVVPEFGSAGMLVASVAGIVLAILVAGQKKRPK